MPTLQIEEVQIGWDVYDSNGEKIGDVAEVTSSYVRAHKSGLRGGDCYIPRAALESAEDRNVYLNVPKAEMSGWDQPPSTAS
jgi:hypothetical protein